jgi:hypothetical protein
LLNNSRDVNVSAVFDQNRALHLQSLVVNIEQQSGRLAMALNNTAEELSALNQAVSRAKRKVGRFWTDMTVRSARLLGLDCLAPIFCAVMAIGAAVARLAHLF